MEIPETLDLLKSKIREDMTFPEMVEAFKDMCNVPVNADDDLIFLETGCEKSEGLYFILTRQFEVEGVDEYYQLSLEIIFPYVKELRKIETLLWSDDDEEDTIDDYFAKVRNTKEYIYICEEQIPIKKCILDLEET